VPNLNDFLSSDDHTRFYMFTGEPGTWKSGEACAFPGPQYQFQFDQKISSLALPVRNRKQDGSLIDYDNYSDWNTARKKLESLQLNCKYKTIVVDSITSQADAINLQTIRVKSGTTNKSGGEAGMRIAGIPVNSLEDYKAENSAFQQTIAILRDIREYHKCNIILIAHVQGEHDKDKQSSRLIITGGKAISGKLAAYCEEIYYFSREKSLDPNKPGERIVSTVHTGNDFARTTLDLPPKIKLDPNKSLYEGYILPALMSLKKKD